LRFAPHAHTRGQELSPDHVLTASLQTRTAASQTHIRKLMGEVQQGKRAALTPSQMAKVLGSRPADTKKIERAARAAGLTCKDRSEAHEAHGIHPVTGTYACFQAMSPGLRLFHWTNKDGETIIAREGRLQVAGNLPITGLYGLETRAKQRTYIRRPTGVGPRTVPTNTTSRGLAKIQGWNFDETDAVARVTAYISLGGDNVQIQDDLKKTCQEEGIDMPQILVVSTDGTPNGDYNDGSTGENTLDLHAHALLNPKGAVVVAFSGNTFDAYAGAAEALNVHPGVKIGDTTLPLLTWSSSWGLPEARDGVDELQRWGRIGQASQLAGIDGGAATGDDGPMDGFSVFTGDAPSVVPWIGGGAGIGIDAPDGRIAGIHAWDDTDAGGGMTGYGISTTFPPLPEEGRLDLPVSANTKKPGHSAAIFADIAAPDSGPFLLYQGTKQQIGGTSHASPFIMAKLAYFKAKYGIKSMWALAYAQGENMVDQITVPNTRAPYPADPSRIYNVMTGFGMPNYGKMNAVCAAHAGA
jgi:hypothetical protein